MKTITKPLHNMKSVFDLIIDEPLPRWKVWLLRKLIPAKFFEIPACELHKFQKGAVIGNITMTCLELE